MANKFDKMLGEFREQDNSNVVNVDGGLVPKGAYNNSTSYIIGDSVDYQGSSYIAISNTTGNLPTDTSKWQVLANKGNIGPQGPKGEDGYIGADGATGPQGPKGDKGDTGDASTVPGPKGDTGDTGPQGVPGADSVVPGPQGEQGIQGIQGEQGIQGIQGETGADSIVPGPQGIQGATGAKGDTGDTGATGPAGNDGVGVVVGGTTGQHLRKKTNTDYDTEWADEQDISGKVDKITGKGLSTNDYTSVEQTKLSGIATGAEVNVNADWNSVSGDSQILNKPTIPTALADLSSDSTHRTVTDTEKSTWNGKQDAGSYEVTTNKVSSFQVTPDDTHYPTEKLVKDSLSSLSDAHFFASTMTVNTGTLNTGTVASLQAVGGTDVNITEASGADPSRVTFAFTGVTRLSAFVLYGYYAGGSGHQVNIEIYNINTTNWDVLGTIGAETAKKWYSFPVYDTTSYINAGAVSTRLRHIQTGNVTHHLILDYMELNYGGSGGTSNISASSVSFMPTGNISSTDVANALSELDTEKVVANGAITGATKTKITYDTKGLITAGADATTADIAASTNKNYVTDAQLTVIGNTSNTNSGDNATNSQYSGLATSKENTGVAAGLDATHAALTTGVHGAGVNSLVYSNDAKLTDARTPVTHDSTKHSVTYALPGDITTHAALTTGVHGAGVNSLVYSNNAALTNARTPTAHASTHVTGSTDIIADAVAGGNSGLMSGASLTKLNGIATSAAANADLTGTAMTLGGSAVVGVAATSSRSDHKHAITNPSIESLAAATDVTTLNASTTAHGLVVKATAPASGLINVVGIGNTETAYTNKPLFDATVPSTQAFGDAAAVGSATVSARRDHKHAMMAAPTSVSGSSGSCTGNAATVTTNANLTGDVTSVGNATTIGAGKVTPPMAPDLLEVVNRQNDTTNTTVTNQIMLMGWGQVVGSGANILTDTITFPVTFSDEPIVQVSVLGYKATSAATLQSQFSPDAGFYATIVPTSAKTGATVKLVHREAAGTLGAGTYYGYAWTVVGTIAR